MARKKESGTPLRWCLLCTTGLRLPGGFWCATCDAHQERARAVAKRVNAGRKRDCLSPIELRGEGVTKPRR